MSERKLKAWQQAGLIDADTAARIHAWEADHSRPLGTRREIRGLDTGILYTSQQRALTLSQKLADPKLQGLLRVKIRSDGVIRPIDLEFRRRVGE